MKMGDPTIIRGFNASTDNEENLIGDEKIVQLKAGKFHSIFLSNLGKLYALGDNRYGQIGVSEHIMKEAKVPYEIITDGMKIKQIEAGHHHSLILDDEGRAYAFGSNLIGQITGKNDQSNYSYLSEIKLPSKSKIVKIKANNVRS